MDSIKINFNDIVEGDMDMLFLEEFAVTEEFLKIFTAAADTSNNEREYNNIKSYSYYHRHSNKNPFHYQGHAPSLTELVSQFKDQDKYQLNKRKVN